MTTQTAQRQVQALESRIETAYQTRVDRELEAIKTRVATGYREIETDARVQAEQSETRRLRVAVGVLGVLLGLLVLALTVGVL